MKGYYEGYSYVGFMPDGTKRRFATEEEYREAYDKPDDIIKRADERMYYGKQHGKNIVISKI